MTCDRREVMCLFRQLKTEIDRVEKKSSDEIHALSETFVPFQNTIATISLCQASLGVIMERHVGALEQIRLINKELVEIKSVLKKERENGIRLKNAVIAALHFMRRKLDPPVTSSLPVIICQPNAIPQGGISATKTYRVINIYEMVPFNPVPPVTSMSQVPAPNAGIAEEAPKPF